MAESLASSLASQVIPVATHLTKNGNGVGVLQCLEHMIGAVRSKVSEVRTGTAARVARFLEEPPLRGLFPGNFS